MFRRPGNEDTRKGCMLYIDEFQVYANMGFANMVRLVANLGALEMARERLARLTQTLTIISTGLVKTQDKAKIGALALIPRQASTINHPVIV